MAQYAVYARDKHGRDTPQSTFGPVIMVEKHEDGKIHVITLNRPHRLNAIGDGLSEGLYDALLAYRDDPAGRVAIVTGAGRAFCAGADLINTAETRAGEASGTRSRRPAGRTPDRYTSPLSESMRLWKPVIGAINGFAIAGGFNIAMQCDIRIMAEDARIGIAEARWNMGGAGWMAPLTRQIGLASALELTLWGDTQYTAQRCYELGWVQRVVPGDQLMETAMSYAQRALDMAPQAVRNMKEVLYRGYYMDPLTGLAFGSALEQNLGGTHDSLEGPRAFSEKRRPNFTDS